MSFHTHIPSPPLSRFVENLFLLCDEPTAAHRELVLPDYGIDLIVNLGEPQRLYDSTNSESYRRFVGGWIAGQRTTPIVVGQTETVNFVGVRFRPSGAYPFLKMPLSELSESVVALDALWGRFVDEIRDRVATAATTDVAFETLEAILLDRLDVDRTRIDDVEYAIDRLMQVDVEPAVGNVVAELGISHKQLTRRFREVVGVTPKRLARVRRFRRVLDAIASTRSPSLVALALRFGFCDQAHLNREFRELAHVAPTRYMELTGAYPGYVPLGG